VYPSGTIFDIYVKISYISSVLLILPQISHLPNLMRSNLKHFFLGALLALVPVIVYANSRLETKYNNNYLDPGTKYLALELIEKSLNSTPTPIPTPTPADKALPTIKPTVIEKKAITPVTQTAALVVHSPKAPEVILSVIKKYSGEYNVSREMMIAIAHCESGFRENAVNGPYAGIYQFIASTWASNRRAMGLDPNPDLRFNAEEATRTAAFKMSRDGFGAWPVCQNKAKKLLSIKQDSL